MSYTPPPNFNDCEDIPALFYQLAGYSSMCWEDVAKAGEFDSTLCKEGAEAAMKRLHEIADIRAFTGEVAQSSGN